MRHIPFTLCILLPLLGSLSHAAPATPLPPTTLIVDIQRYLLLYSATGDERFLERLNTLAPEFEEGIATQKNAATLKDIWGLYLGAVEKVRDAYTSKDIDLRKAVSEAQEVSALFDSFILEDTETAPQSLADNLRRLALLKVLQANSELLGQSQNDDKLNTLSSEIENQLDTLSVCAEEAPQQCETLKRRWQYLRLTGSTGHLLLYPFNAQIEYLLSRLPAD
ncbi:hypothetical protein D3C78_309880 [compost metagenome]